MVTQIHAFGSTGELSPGAEAALEGLGGGGGGAVLIAERSISGDTMETFTGIPDTYRSLRLEWWTSRQTTGGATSKIFLNEDYGANYATSGNAGGQTGITFSSGRLALGAYGYVTIPDYKLTGPASRVVMGQIAGTINAGNENFATALVSGAWVSTDIVTAVSFQAQNSGTTGYIRLYGVL